MPLTPQQALGVIKSRKIQVLPIRNHDGSTGWVAKTIDGSRAGPPRASFSSPEEAIEAAELRFSEAEAREAESKAQIIIAALEKGRYFVKPKEVTTGTGQDRVTTVLFDVFLSNGNPTNIKDRPSFLQAVIDMENTFK